MLLGPFHAGEYAGDANGSKCASPGVSAARRGNRFSLRPLGKLMIFNFRSYGSRPRFRVASRALRTTRFNKSRARNVNGISLTIRSRSTCWKILACRKFNVW